MLAGILVVVAVVVAITVPKIRRPIAARIAEARPALRVVRSPIKLAGLLGGNFVAQFLLALVLGFDRARVRPERDARRAAAP